MLLKSLLSVLFMLVHSNALETIFKHALIEHYWTEQTCEDRLQTLEETCLNQSIYSARIEELLECKEKEVQHERETCIIKLFPYENGTSNNTAIENLEREVINLKQENNRIRELLSYYIQLAGNLLSNFVPTHSIAEFSIADCGGVSGANIFDVLKTKYKRYFIPNSAFSRYYSTYYKNWNLNWTEAYKFCEKCELQLATFETQDEFDALANYFNTTYRRYQLYTKYHIGVPIQDQTNETFTWLNGAKVNLSEDSFYGERTINDAIIYLTVLANPITYEDSGKPYPYNKTLYLTYGNMYHHITPLCESK